MAAKKVKKESVAAEMPTPTGDRLELLRDLFPEAFAEGKLDLSRLRDAVGDLADDRPEKYSFGWSGKRDAIRVLQTPSRATLVPCPDESVDWDTTRNVFIEGDNLEVLKLLYKSYAGRVKLIYIDPPYNTGQDFIYPDNFADPLDTYLKLSGQKDSEGNLLTSNPETNGRYHSAWLSMMYPRLFLARQMMANEGVIFISIGEEEVANLRLLANEVFGEENFIATIVWQRSKRGDSKLIARIHEYVLVYARNKGALIQEEKWRLTKNGVDEVLSQYDAFRKELGSDHEAIGKRMSSWYSSLPKDDPRRSHQHYRWSDARGLYFADNFAGPDDGRKNRPRYDIFHPVSKEVCAKPSTGWRWSEERTRKALAADPPLIHFGPDHTTVPCRKTYLKNVTGEPLVSVLYRDGRAATLEVEKLVGEGVMDFPKNTDVIRQFIELVTDPGDIVLDFFAGSATTGQAVFELNLQSEMDRQFILVQLPEPTGEDSRAKALGFQSIADVAQQRLRGFLETKKQEADLFKDEDNRDLGFRTYRLASSHNRQWSGVPERDAEALGKQMALFVDPLLPGWKTLPVIHEVAMREGYSLSCRVEELSKKTTKPNVVYRVTDSEKEQSFLICLDDKVSQGVAKALGLTKDDLFICRDVALTDEIAANLALQCRLKTI